MNVPWRECAWTVDVWTRWVHTAVNVMATSCLILRAQDVLVTVGRWIWIKFSNRSFLSPLYWHSPETRTTVYIFLLFSSLQTCEKDSVIWVSLMTPVWTHCLQLTVLCAAVRLERPGENLVNLVLRRELVGPEDWFLILENCSSVSSHYKRIDFYSLLLRLFRGEVAIWLWRIQARVCTCINFSCEVFI